MTLLERIEDLACDFYDRNLCPPDLLLISEDLYEELCCKILFLIGGTDVVSSPLLQQYCTSVGQLTLVIIPNITNYLVVIENNAANQYIRGRTLIN